MKNLWRPIAELTDKYRTDLLLCAPELVDLDCNVHGIGMGYYQDGRDWDGPPTAKDLKKPDQGGGFLAAKWNMTNDEWDEVKVTPTHFIIMEGPLA